MKKIEQQLVPILYQALKAERGVVVTTSDPERLRKELGRVRQGNKEFGSLIFRTSPRNPETELWIVKEIKDAETPGEPNQEND